MELLGVNFESILKMKRGFEYWERAYFDGWLGKLLVGTFIGLCFYAVIETIIEPWAIDLLCRQNGVRVMIKCLSKTCPLSAECKRHVWFQPTDLRIYMDYTNRIERVRRRYSCDMFIKKPHCG